MYMVSMPANHKWSKNLSKKQYNLNSYYTSKYVVECDYQKHLSLGWQPLQYSKAVTKFHFFLQFDSVKVSCTLYAVKLLQKLPFLLVWLAHCFIQTSALYWKPTCKHDLQQEFHSWWDMIPAEISKAISQLDECRHCSVLYYSPETDQLVTQKEGRSPGLKISMKRNMARQRTTGLSHLPTLIDLLKFFVLVTFCPSGNGHQDKWRKWFSLLLSGHTNRNKYLTGFLPFPYSI